MSMTLAELAQDIPNLATWNHVERIKLFAWYLHTQKKQDHFQAPALVEMDVGCRHDLVQMVMLQVGQSP